MSGAPWNRSLALTAPGSQGSGTLLLMATSEVGQTQL
jgi:hypothetical protein